MLGIQLNGIIIEFLKTDPIHRNVINSSTRYKTRHFGYSQFYFSKIKPKTQKLIPIWQILSFLTLTRNAKTVFCKCFISFSPQDMKATIGSSPCYRRTIKASVELRGQYDAKYPFNRFILNVSLNYFRFQRSLRVA